MSDIEDTPGSTEQPLRYIGATTRHEGSGEKPRTLPKVAASKLTGDLQPGVTGDAEPQHRSER